MKTILMILLLSLPLLSNENEITEPSQTLYEVKVLKKSPRVMTFTELEEIQYFMKRNDLYEVWIKNPTSNKWRRYWRNKCSCEVHSSVL